MKKIGIGFSMIAFVCLFLMAVRGVYAHPSQAALAEGWVAGVVTDQGTGQPIRNISVGAQDVNMGWTTVQTDSQGRFRILVNEGQYRVEFNDHQGFYLDEWYDNASSYETATIITVTGGLTTTVNAQLGRAGRIRGYLNWDWSPSSTDTAELSAYNPTTHTFAGGSSLTNPGYYEIVGLPTGQYKIGTGFNIHPTDYVLILQYARAYFDLQDTFAEGETINVTEGVTTTLDIDLTNLGQICGSVTDLFTTQPVPHMVIQALNEQGEVMAQAGTEVNGSYCFWNMAPGSYQVVFTGDVWPDWCWGPCWPDHLFQVQQYPQIISLAEGKTFPELMQL